MYFNISENTSTFLNWYGFFFAFGYFLCWRSMKYVAQKTQIVDCKSVDTLMIYVTIFTYLGGRAGFILFYEPLYFANHPAEILIVSHGGMSFHGGLLGAVLALVVFSRLHSVEFLVSADLLAMGTPLGLFSGRIGNFLTSDLVGKVTNTHWGVIFERVDLLPRHPSQIYEALGEGLVLFLFLQVIGLKFRYLRRTGYISASFLIGYAVARVFCEIWRESASSIAGLSLGQIYSIPLFILGIVIILYCRKLPSRNLM